MADCEKLEKQARHSAANVDFDDLLALARCWGFEFQRQKGSHVLFKQVRFPQPSRQEMRKRFGMMNFQEEGGQAKPYQVRQLLKAIDYYRNKHLD